MDNLKIENIELCLRCNICKKSGWVGWQIYKIPIHQKDLVHKTILEIINEDWTTCNCKKGKNEN